MESDFGNFKKIGIVGIGQIGGSLGIAFKTKIKNVKITGCDVKDELLEKAFFLDFKTKNLIDLLECEIIFLSTPVLQIIKILEELENMHFQGIVIDTGSTKETICREAEKLNIKFVGGHPLAGNEKRAPYAWDEKMFEKNPFFICDVKKDRSLIRIAENIVKIIGARPVLIDPEYHDKMLSLTSHLPYLISLLFLKNSKEKIFEGPAFKSFTRIALQSPDMFADIILTNKENIKKTFETIKKEINYILTIDKKKRLLEVLNENQKTR